ncbi:unnamed protein product [Choristocarpus tenellus]
MQVESVECRRVLVKCPECRACLPLGLDWNQHREKHLVLHRQMVQNLRTLQATHAPPSPPPLPSSAVRDEDGAYNTNDEEEVGHGENVFNGGRAIRTQSQPLVLSKLLCHLKHASATAQFLESQGLVGSDWTTRFTRTPNSK